MPADRGVAAAVLAAGGARRFGGGKLLAPLDGRPLLAHAVEAALRSGLRPVLVVVGADGDEVTGVVRDTAVRAGVSSDDVEIVANPEWEEGISSSLRAVLRCLGPRQEVSAVVLGLGDQPRVLPDTYERLAEAHLHGEADLVAATYRGRRRNPVLLGRSLWQDAMGIRGDEGARVLLRTRPVVEVPCEGDPVDVDTAGDLRELEEG